MNLNKTITAILVLKDEVRARYVQLVRIEELARKLPDSPAKRELLKEIGNVEGIRSKINSQKSTAKN